MLGTSLRLFALALLGTQWSAAHALPTTPASFADLDTRENYNHVPMTKCSIKYDGLFDHVDIHFDFWKQQRAGDIVSTLEKNLGAVTLWKATDDDTGGCDVSFNIAVQTSSERLFGALYDAGAAVLPNLCTGIPLRDAWDRVQRKESVWLGRLSWRTYTRWLGQQVPLRRCAAASGA